MVDRVGPMGAEQEQVRSQRGPRGLLRQARDDLVCRGVQGLHDVAADDVLGCHIERVGVPLGGLAQAGRGVGLPAQERCGRSGRVVAGEHPLEQVGGRQWADQLGPYDAVRVAVADYLKVDVVAQGAAGHHRVELLAGLLAAGQCVHRVHRDALGGVHRGGVPELGPGLDVFGGQAHRAPGLGVLDGEVAGIVDAQHHPPVAVLDPVRGGGAQRAVVGAGDDQLADAGLVPVSEQCGGQRRPGRYTRWPLFFAEPVSASPLVQLADQLAGGSEHDRIQAPAPVGLPRGEDVLGHGGQVPDVHPAGVQIEPERLALSLALREGQSEALGVYLDSGRVHVGDLATMTEDVFTAWQADRGRGLDSIMLAPTRELVQLADQRARAHRLGEEQGPAGIPAGPALPTALLADGNQASIGELIITRSNDRALRTSSTDWVKNGDRWMVLGIHDAGDLTVQHTQSGRTVRLPAEYVQAWTELGYATTVHTAQGVSVDTMHALASGQENRQQFYTMMTRGALGNHIYLQVVGDGDPHSVIRPELIRPLTPTDLLEGMLARDDAPRSATTLLRGQADPATCLGQAAQRYADALNVAAEDVVGRNVAQALDASADRVVAGLSQAPAT